jgi:hypothetical protein
MRLNWNDRATVSTAHPCFQPTEKPRTRASMCRHVRRTSNAFSLACTGVQQLRSTTDSATPSPFGPCLDMCAMQSRVPPLRFRVVAAHACRKPREGFANKTPGKLKGCRAHAIFQFLMSDKLRAANKAAQGWVRCAPVPDPLPHMWQKRF